jgi:diguanylate cyclase (GGDEF)-like protein
VGELVVEVLQLALVLVGVVQLGQLDLEVRRLVQFQLGCQLLALTTRPTQGGTAMSASRTTPRVPRAFVVLIASALGVALVGGLAITVLPVAESGGLRLPWWLLTVPFAVFELVVLNVQIGREARSVSLSEIPMAVGLAFAAAPDLIAARVLGAMVIYIFVRGQHKQPIKLLFNVVVALTEAVLAVAVFRLVSQGTGPVAPLSWLGIEVGNVIASCFAAMAVGLVIQIFEDGLSLRELITIVPISATQAAMVSTMGLICVVTLDASSAAAALLVVVAVAFVLAYRAYSTLNERHLSLERVYRFTHAMSTSQAMSDVLLGVLSQAREMLHAERAVIRFLTEDRGVEISLDKSGTLQRGPVRILTDELDSPLAEALSGAGSVLVSRGTGAESGRTWLGARGLREILVAPMRGESGASAVLAVADRLGEARGFDHEDARLLETVANHAAIALHNGRLVDQLRHDSQHDALTGLPNRVFLQRAIDDHLADISSGETVVVGMLDLDNFKDVNDTLGHEPGDDLLRVVAARLVEAGDPDTVVARLGGDEFAVVYYARPDEIRDIADALIINVSRPVTLNGIDVEVGGSLGITSSAISGTSRETLLKHADTAMYRAKSNDEDVCVWSPEPGEAGVDRLALVSKLRNALHTDALDINVQPKVEFATGRLLSLEALVRWTDSERGEIEPGEFVSLAERSGLIRPLTDVVLQKAISACAGWQANLPGVGVAVNVSVKNLTHDALIDRVSFLLRRYCVPANLLTLEITESSVMSDPARILEVLGELHDLGVQLSIDDFGTGYSSLSYLQRLPVQEVKIDRSFVTGVSQDHDNTAIARSIIELATALQLTVVAEGVESAADWSLLRDLDCAVGQGYLIARPMPVDQVATWYAGWQHPSRNASAG